MVTIVSDEIDISTNKVMAYLHSMGIQVSRISPESSLEFYDSNAFENLLELSNWIWLRRGNLPFIRTFHYRLHNEFKILKSYLFYRIEHSANCLGSLVKEYNHNKLIDLEKAKKVGLRIPHTQIVVSHDKLKSIIQTGDYITKSLTDPLVIYQDGIKYNGGFTSEIKYDSISNESENYFPSLIQEKIDKEFEIRSFYLRGDLYSMAIFSQNDDQTRTDFRHYNRERPNRNVPFKLPKSLEKKLIELMQLIDLNTGSIDIIYSKSGEFVFLEVNPVGQYDWLSMNCNYHLDLRIAELLAS